MTEAHFLSPPDPVSRPRLTPPVGATDCHAHVFGPFSLFPLGENRSYTTAELPGERYLKMLAELGLSRGVLVTPSAYGTDNRAMLAALQLAPARLRGVAVLSPEVTDRELRQMHDAGVRGARFSVLPGDTFRGTVGFEALKSLAPRLSDLGWHAQVWAFGDLLVEAAPDLLKLGLRLVIDHMGMFDYGKGIAGDSFQWLLRALRGGRVWLKLTAYRLSSSFPDYPELAPFHHALLEENPDRLVWGSDWPHVHLAADMPDAGHLLDLFDAWTPSAELRRRILVDNPSRLYGF